MLGSGRFGGYECSQQALFTILTVCFPRLFPLQILSLASLPCFILLLGSRARLCLSQYSLSSDV